MKHNNFKTITKSCGCVFQEWDDEKGNRVKLQIGVCNKHLIGRDQ